jgi:hypothetical protein
MMDNKECFTLQREYECWSNGHYQCNECANYRRKPICSWHLLKNAKGYIFLWYGPDEEVSKLKTASARAKAG